MWYTGLYKQTKGVTLESNKDLENLLDWKGKSKKKSKRENPWVTCKGCGKKFNGETRLEWHIEDTLPEYRLHTSKLTCYKEYKEEEE